MIFKQALTGDGHGRDLLGQDCESRRAAFGQGREYLVVPHDPAFALKHLIKYMKAKVSKLTSRFTILTTFMFELHETQAMEGLCQMTLRLLSTGIQH